MKIIINFFVLFFVISCTQVDVKHEKQKGIRLYKNDSIQESISSLTKVINITDTCSECFLYRGFAYKDLNQYNKAMKDFNSYIKVNPKDEIGYANRASIYYLQKNYPKALIDFQKALELNPKFTIMYNTISHMLFITGKKDEACNYYQKALLVGDTIFNSSIIKYCNNRK